MDIVYFGTAPFAVPALKRLASHIRLVVTQPDRPSGRGLKLQASPVKQVAQELGLPVESPEKVRNPEFLDLLATIPADVFVVAAYGQIVPQAVLDMPARGCINLHGSILPRWRGAAPIQRAIEAGDTESGVTLMQMDKGMDTGDIISIARTPIGKDERAGELYSRLATLAADEVEAWIEKIVAGDYPRTPQDDALATHAAKVTKDDAKLETRTQAQVAYDKFRAFTPAPGAWLETASGPLKVHSASLLKDRSGEPGTILDEDSSLVVAFNEGALALDVVQPAGKAKMSGRDYRNGARLRPGSCLNG